VRNLLTTDPLFDELGKYILVECRNYVDDKVDAKALRDFAGKVINANCTSGILVTTIGYSGDEDRNSARDARLAILKSQQRHGVTIIPMTLDQVEPVTEKNASLLDLLVSEYEKIRFDLAETASRKSPLKRKQKADKEA
jgi:restriction endonuclease